MYLRTTAKLCACVGGWPCKLVGGQREAEGGGERERERTSVTVINAFLMHRNPLRYMRETQSALALHKTL